MSWQKKGREIAAGKRVDFADGEFHDIWFINEPREEVIEDRDKKGEYKEVLIFDVEENGKKKELMPSPALLRALIEEDEDEPIVGRQLRIKKKGDGFQTRWTIKEGERGRQQRIQSPRPARAEQQERQEQEGEAESSEPKKRETKKGTTTCTTKKRKTVEEAADDIKDVLEEDAQEEAAEQEEKDADKEPLEEENEHCTKKGVKWT